MWALLQVCGTASEGGAKPALMHALPPCTAVCPPSCSNPIVEASASGRQGFNYLFYIDFVGALSNPNCQNALRHLQVSVHVLVVRGMGRCAEGRDQRITCCRRHPTLCAVQESAPFMRVLGSYPMETDLGRLDSNTPFDSINES